MKQHMSAAMLLAAIVALGSVRPAAACPFCSAVTQTICERIDTSDVAVLAELVESPPPATDAAAPISNEAIEAAKSTFRVVKVYRGAKYIRPGDTFKTLYYGKTDPGVKCLATALEPSNLQWGLPLELNARALEYVERAVKLPPSGADRLVFFEDYLEAPEQALQEDAIAEFARADFPTLQTLHGRLNHDRLLRWINDPAVLEPRRRLYFVLLGVCGDAKDAPLLEKMIRSGDPVQMRGLDALLASYILLGGSKGLPLVEDQFLRSKKAEFPQMYAAVMAIRILGEQQIAITRKRATEALRLMLDRPEYADIVIPDLARWEDWGSIDRITKLFKEAPKERNYVRESVINYLRACPLPEAKTKLDELAKLDPGVFRSATMFFPMSPSTGATRPKTKAKAKPPGSDKQGAATTPASAATATASTAPAAATATPTKSAAKPSTDKSPQAVLSSSAPQTAATAAATAAAIGGAARIDAPPAAPSVAAASKPEGKSAQLLAVRSVELARGTTAASLSEQRHRTWTTCVVAAPPAGAVILLVLFWLILRPPHQNRLNRTS